jgi:hypothetical protein
MSIDSMYENRETPAEPAAGAGAGRSEKAGGPKSDWEAAGESDCGIVPMNRSNEAAQAAEEMEEGRTQTKGNAQEPHMVRTQSRVAKSQGLEGVREAAFQRHAPKVGAVCGNAARTDLCGGREVISVPTATQGGFAASVSSDDSGTVIFRRR